MIKALEKEPLNWHDSAVFWKAKGACFFMRIPSLQLIASMVVLFVISAFAVPSHAWPRRDFDRDSRTPEDVLGQLPEARTLVVTEGSREPQQLGNGMDLVEGSEPLDIPDYVNGLGGIRQASPGFSHPVRWMRLMRGFDGNNCWHQGLDIASQGPMAGIGQPIYSIVKSKVTFIGTPEMNPSKYGRRDRRGGAIKRGGVMIPRRVKVDGYPTLYPFTRGLGSAKTGVFIITQAMRAQAGSSSAQVCLWLASRRLKRLMYASR